jgi:hypothetical protein
MTHAEGPIFLNVLRYTDLPEAAALFAPRRLTIFGHMPQAFEYTKHLWEVVRSTGKNRVVIALQLVGFYPGTLSQGLLLGSE